MWCSRGVFSKVILCSGGCLPSVTMHIYKPNWTTHAMYIRYNTKSPPPLMFTDRVKNASTALSQIFKSACYVTLPAFLAIKPSLPVPTAVLYCLSHILPNKCSCSCWLPFFLLKGPEESNHLFLKPEIDFQTPCCCPYCFLLVFHYSIYNLQFKAATGNFPSETGFFLLFIAW